jgi:Ni,Fe-hydrogenase III component G
MNTEDALQKAQEMLTPWATATAMPALAGLGPNRLDITLTGERLVQAVAALSQARWGYLSAITGLDLGLEAGEMEVLYHFCTGAAILTLRVRTPRANPSVSSICDVIPSASLFERELQDLLGVTVVGTPNSDRLVLPDEWPQGVYPLRKDFARATNDE